MWTQRGNWSLCHLRLYFGCDLIGNRILLLSRYLSFVLLSDSRSLADAIHLGVKPSSRRSLSSVERKRLSHRQNPPLYVLLSVFKWQKPPALQISVIAARQLGLTSAWPSSIDPNQPKRLIPAKEYRKRWDFAAESTVLQRFKERHSGLGTRGGRRHKTSADGA